MKGDVESNTYCLGRKGYINLSRNLAKLYSRVFIIDTTGLAGLFFFFEFLFHYTAFQENFLMELVDR